MKPLSWLYVLLPAILLSLSAAACSIDPLDDGPTPTPTLPPVRELPPQTERALGPLLSQGAFCWHDLESGIVYLRFALFNPTQSAVRFRIDPYGTGIVRAFEGTMTDPLDISTIKECRYKVEVRRNDEGNSYLGEDYELLLDGVTIHAPVRASIRLVRRYFSDLQRGNLDSMQAYVDTTNSVQGLGASIAWREGISPVKFSVTNCSPRFEHVALSRGSFAALAYDCSVSVTYSDLSEPPGSGTWSGLVTSDYVEKKMTLHQDTTE